MAADKPDIQADTKPVTDRGEPVSMMEPLLLSGDSPHRPSLLDLALELAQKSAALSRSLPESLLSSLADLVRSMNCYYSNLIEGHDTHPIDIERALKNDYSEDAKKRDLQLEAKAHIAVQQWIDIGSLKGRGFTTDAIREVHRRFCEQLPDDLLRVDDAPGGRIRIVPGELRLRDVEVGQLVPISPLAVPRFLHRFEEVYRNLGKAETILAVAAAHHRLAWIHPFLDGNGRVARLLSHAVLLEMLDTGSIWSVARGLARNVDAYKRHLAACDQPRRNDLDGRGNLSEENLAGFTRFFLVTCIDQVAFMEALMQPEQLRTRILTWAEEETRLNRIPQKSTSVLEAILFRGELRRADAAAIVGTGERQARRVISALVEQGVLTSDSIRAPLRLSFPAALAPRWMPGLFPDRPA
jgi:Fic family protein